MIGSRSLHDAHSFGLTSRFFRSHKIRSFIKSNSIMCLQRSGMTGFFSICSLIPSASCLVSAFALKRGYASMIVSIAVVRCLNPFSRLRLSTISKHFLLNLIGTYVFGIVSPSYDDCLIGRFWIICFTVMWCIWCIHKTIMTLP